MTDPASGSNTIDTLAAALVSGNRTALARAITAIESARNDHRAEADRLLKTLLPKTGGAIRLGITGAPGVGKSTLIDQLGLNLIAAGHKVAVLAVDPTSTRTQGSILGDKTRMERLARDKAAFIRPSPSGATLGGVAQRTREAMLICEAAGFDVVIVETVGTGQSETTVASMVDFFVVLALPGAGDDLQGIKKGILEIADIIVINKADGDLVAAATRSAADTRTALNILGQASPNWRPPVLTVSALKNRGIDTLWTEVQRHDEIMKRTGEHAAKRRNQRVDWFNSLIETKVLDRFFSTGAVKNALPRLQTAVQEGKITPTAAAEEILNQWKAD
ncbi:YgfD: protein that forms a complex with the methylmalonyl-CoA mutase in a pathway for conversion of succinyl-CoA to propionyl-CoA [hydrothermal vent metagenome]|uniref:YgfD: protein that forms a complex with the methylmalonyl-CoA mutase in a pathway for conversion of succinyl-CoA to propionyl-CoA n=1 Tax=hydrothermal vent metagenome TaxID=652676 RepID=A0A3B0U8R8_9ZZZZ